MLYVILLLVIVGALVALMLKKRNAEKQTAAKPIAKKSASKTKLVEEPVAVKKTTTPLSADVRQKIESLIQQQNYFAAEAQINQALNRDNTQHELYLLLLEIHMLQKDEFAISQLINHIRSLELDDILAQAEQKKSVYDAENQKAVKDTIEFKLDSDTTATPAKTVTAAPVIVEETNAFDTLVAEPKQTVETAVDEKPLTFDFSKAPAAVSPAPVAEPVEAPKALEFESFSFDTENKVSEPTTQPTIQPVEAPAEAVAPTLDFESPTLDLAPTETVAPVENIEPIKLDFSGFDTKTETPVEEPAAKNELDFSFTTPEPAIESQPKPVVEAEPAAPSLDFNFSVAETPATPVVEETPVVSTEAPNLDFNLFGTPAEIAQPEPVVETVDANDPLVKSFPELQDVNEINLNLDLAAQYIQLGAFEAARELLDERTEGYSAEQNQRAQELRNQLA